MMLKHLNIQKIMSRCSRKIEMGAFSTRTIFFDPFNCYYEVITPNAKEKEGELKKQLVKNFLN
jgi:hypothetical protein